MAASSSSAPNLAHLLKPYGGGPTSAPPPTPSTQPNLSSSSDAAADTLSRLLHRLPPNLSLPTRLSPRASTPTNKTCPLPTTSSPYLVPPTSFQLGYFQLTGHPITQQLAESAESEALSLYNLPHDKKITLFSKEWPLGFDHGDDDDDAETGSSFCMDATCSTTAEGESAEFELSSLRELTRELEKVSLEVVESVMSAMGLENPLGSKKVEAKSLMWVSDGDKEGRVYPYVVGLQYQIRSQKWSLVSESGLACVEPQVGSVLVTFGDIAQVWSNGKLKKVRGRPTTIVQDRKSNSHCITMTLLLTLPLESTVSPLLTTVSSKTSGEIEVPSSPTNDHAKGKTYDDEISIEEISKDEGNELDDDDERLFNSFSFEDYAWRVYHERIPSKDPLVRYRIVD